MQERLSMLFLYLLLLYLKAGASLGQSLLYITEHAESFFIKKRAKDLYDKLILGHSFNEIIKEQADLFSPETRALIQIGMKSGKLQEALEKALDLSKERVQKKVTLLTTLINPLAMIIIALLILGLLLILYMPIFTLSSTPRLSF